MRSKDSQLNFINFIRHINCDQMQIIAYFKILSLESYIRLRPTHGKYSNKKIYILSDTTGVKWPKRNSRRMRLNAVGKDVEKFLGIRNWRREAMDREFWKGSLKKAKPDTWLSRHGKKKFI